MCVTWTKDWYPTKRSILLLKLCRLVGGKLLSLYPQNNRDPQREGGLPGLLLYQGVTIEYSFDKEVRANNPGIYLYNYNTKIMAKNLLVGFRYMNPTFEPVVVVQGEVPKGALVRSGMYHLGIFGSEPKMTMNSTIFIPRKIYLPRLNKWASEMKDSERFVV